jgi:molybdopterin-containing oxidoreductase family membrane subunit
MTPDTLGEIYEYRPTWVEWSVSAGIFGIGFLVFTVLVKLAVPIMAGHFTKGGAAAQDGEESAPEAPPAEAPAS